MRPASPRKSSTSSGRRERARTRYLGIEVAGEPLPPVPPARWSAWLSEPLGRAGLARVAFRIVRTEGRRAVVRVGALDAPVARRAWDGATVGGGTVALTTARTWGTLVGAKRWLGARGGSPPRAPPTTRR
jgi:hypothetical protein